MDEEALAIESIRQYVWSGFYDADGVVEMLEEAVFCGGEIDHGWLRVQMLSWIRPPPRKAMWPCC